MGRLSLALGTAIQFETALRQKDVIGEWEPIPDGVAGSGIVLNGRRWVPGLTWSDIGSDLVIRKATSKTGAFAAHDLNLCPFTRELLDIVPADERVGPLIVDEKAGRPYAESAYGREWRVVARAAGVPDHVWNMDARAGAITEAEDAGADLDHIRSAAAHSQTSTTQRYSRGAVGKSRRGREEPRVNSFGEHLREHGEPSVNRRVRKRHQDQGIGWSGRSGSNRGHSAWEAALSS